MVFSFRERYVNYVQTVCYLLKNSRWQKTVSASRCLQWGLIRLFYLQEPNHASCTQRGWKIFSSTHPERIERGIQRLCRLNRGHNTSQPQSINQLGFGIWQNALNIKGSVKNRSRRVSPTHDVIAKHDLSICSCENLALRSLASGFSHALD